MKKHFHPLTIENLERVWKAEDKKRKEDERIQQLQEELAAERQREAFQNQAIASGLQKYVYSSHISSFCVSTFYIPHCAPIVFYY